MRLDAILQVNVFWNTKAMLLFQMFQMCYKIVTLIYSTLDNLGPRQYHLSYNLQDKQQGNHAEFKSTFEKCL